MSGENEKRRIVQLDYAGPQNRNIGNWDEVMTCFMAGMMICVLILPAIISLTFGRSVFRQPRRAVQAAFCVAGMTFAVINVLSWSFLLLFACYTLYRDF
ncbi:MAG TPA: hypothetical protein VHD56_15620 [Tepidisphaeraceae bacterium]|nr:hypothetical protein [Tepidisphaeraceae bacterium]